MYGSLKKNLVSNNKIYEAVSGWGPGFDLSPKNAYFGGKYFKDQNSDTDIFRLITKM